MRLRPLLPGAAAAALVAALALAGALEPAELGLLDRLFELRGPRRPAAPVVIVTIDEDTFDELDLPWPFPRALHGQLLERIAAARPLAIGLDVLFPEPSVRGPDDDAALGTAVARAGNVVLAAAITVVAEPFYVKTDLNPPVPAVREGAAAVAPVNHTVDPDGHLRRATLRYRVAERELDAWAVALYRLARSGGLAAAPLPEAAEILINFRGGPRTFPWVPYHRVLSGGVPPETFRGAVVLVGATSPALQDVFSTPFARARQMPGVEVHANTLDTLLRGDAVRALPAWVSLALAVGAAAAGAALPAVARATWAGLAALGVAAALAGGTVLAFAVADVWVRAAGPLLGLALGYGGAVVDGVVCEQRAKRRLARFFSPAVAAAIVRARGDALGSRRQVVSVLFADIRGFTAIAERADPEVVGEMLREYLTAMTEVVFRHHGTVDKYIGDAIMALFNAPLPDPDHAVHAVRTALELQERALAVSARWRARLGVELRNGVGVATGEAVVGALGSRQRLEYTAVGDTVNLAARLEALTKEYGVGVLIDEATAVRVRGGFLLRALPPVVVRGRTQPVPVYSVVATDLRRYPRATVEAAARLTAVGRDATVTVRVADLGPGGLCVVGLPEDWPVGARVAVRCEGGALPTPVEAEGRIVWRRGERAGLAFGAPASAAEAGPAI